MLNVQSSRLLPLSTALTVGALVLAACGGSGAGPSAAPPIERTVTVTGGYGSGSYRPGTTVHVWSAVSTTSGVAGRWSGDATLLVEPGEWHTSFVMPDRDVTLLANSTTQTLTLSVATFTGVTSVPKTVRYHFPPVMRGVVLISHGTGGTSDFIQRTEPFPLALALVADGYASSRRKPRKSSRVTRTATASYAGAPGRPPTTLTWATCRRCLRTSSAGD